MVEKKDRKTKRKVDLVSSHSERDCDNGPLAAYSTEGSAVSELYKTMTGSAAKHRARMFP
jgi:hypothetical protein